MEIVISYPTSNDYQKLDTKIIQYMSVHDFNFQGAASGILNCRDLEFYRSGSTDNDFLDLMESNLRQMIDDTSLRLYVESE